MDIEFYRVVTKDKLILQGLLYKPVKPTNKAILHIHGMAGNFYENKFLDSMAKYFTKKGWSFLTVNTRGHDFIADFPLEGKEEKYKRVGNVWEKIEDCVLDIEPWINFLEGEGYKKIILQGHSLGAVKSVYYLAKKQDKRISRLILASPPDMIGLAEEGKGHKRILKLSKRMVKQGKGDHILHEKLWGWYYLSANTYLDFGERDRPIDVFNTYDKNKPSILANVKIPTLAFFGSKDDAAILSVKEALEIIKGKAKNCPQFDTGVIADAPHSYFGHENEVARRIISWLEKGNF